MLDILVQRAAQPGGGRGLPPPCARGQRLPAAGGRHGQTRQLPAGRAACSRGGAPTAQRLEQPSGELAPADAATRTGAATVQVAEHAQRFLSAFSGISPTSARAYSPSAADYRQVMATASRSGTRSPARRPRPPPESATGTGCFVQATAHHHIGQLGWLKLTMPPRSWSGSAAPTSCARRSRPEPAGLAHHVPVLCRMRAGCLARQRVLLRRGCGRRSVWRLGTAPTRSVIV